MATRIKSVVLFNIVVLCLLYAIFSQINLTVFAITAAIVCFSISLGVLIARVELKILSLTIAILFATVSLLELRFFFTYNPLRYGGDYITPRKYFVDHPILGYSPPPNFTTIASRHYKKQELYKVKYSINQQGLRVTPKSDALDSIIFFGGSHTFGEGVEDNENFPYLVAEKLVDNYATFNFAFHGYGPHQMLAALEKELVQKVIGNKKPKYIFYVALLHHIERANGYAIWDRTGPYYTLKDKHITFQGNFSSSITDFTFQSLKSSHSLRHLYFSRNFKKKQHVELMANIVLASALFVKKYYPDCQFHILLWKRKYHLASAQKLINFWKANQLPVHLIGDIIPDYVEEEKKYVLHTYDTHPNCTAHTKIAHYFCDIIKK